MAPDERHRGYAKPAPGSVRAARPAKLILNNRGIFREDNHGVLMPGQRRIPDQPRSGTKPHAPHWG